MGTITILNTTQYKEHPIPEVGEEYHTFDDGKIKPSRHSIARVTEVIPFAEVNHEALLEEWRQEVMDCYWLYATETDYFAMADDPDDDEEPMYFVRTQDGGWFSIGFWGGRLDINGHLYAAMVQEYGEISNG